MKGEALRNGQLTRELLDGSYPLGREASAQPIAHV